MRLASDDADGVSDMQRALQIFQRLSVIEAIPLATELDALTDHHDRLLRTQWIPDAEPHSGRGFSSKNLHSH
jgi:hypothetical protein